MSKKDGKFMIIVTFFRQRARTFRPLCMTFAELSYITDHKYENSLLKA